MNQPYALHGLTPQHVARPTSLEELASVVLEASEAGAAVVPWGAGTRQHIGNPPSHYDLALDTTALNRIVDYSPADLVITVEAGATLGQVQRELAQHGQWLPWLPPRADEATIGGLLASGSNGVLRLGYGTPRDWLLAMQVVLGNGRLVRSGAKVVKNVAGYDTHKLHLGALGTLGVIGEVTLKVAPLPTTSQTLVAAVPEREAAFALADALRDIPLQPTSVVLFEPRTASLLPASVAGGAVSVAVRFAGVPAAVARQLHEATARAGAIGATTQQADDAAFWPLVADLSRSTADGSLLLRIGVPASALSAAVQAVEQPGWDTQWLALSGVGIVYARWWPGDATLEQAQQALAQLRGSLAALGGYTVVEETPTAYAGALSVWGAPPPGFALMQGLHKQWNPANTLNPGRYF